MGVNGCAPDGSAVSDDVDANRRPHTGRDTSPLAELLIATAAGQTEAFEQLFASIRTTIHLGAMAVVRDTGQAEEVCQEVLAEIWRTAVRYDPDKGSAAAWIRRLTHSRAVDRVRHAHSIQARDHRYHQSDHSDIADDVAEQVLRNVTAEELHRALDSLTALQREALVLTYFQGQSNEQASIHLGIPVPTLKSRVLSALHSLRRIQTETT